MTLIEGDSYQNRSTSVITPTRGTVPGKVYASHIALRWPLNVPREGAVAVGLEVAHAYNQLFEDALKKKCAFALTLEDDMLVPPDVIARLHARMIEHPEFSGISALYYTKGATSLPLLIGHPEHKGDTTVRSLPAEAGLLEVNAIPMGCALWRLSFLADLKKPWFSTTENTTQDVFFCQQAREIGARFAVDTSLRVGHFDVRSGKTF